MDLATWRSTPWIGGYGVRGQFVTGPSRKDGPVGSLQAWDPVRQRLAWEVPLDGLFDPGTLSTAGNLVFQGRVDGSFRAYAAETGRELWRYDLGLGIAAPPITYAVNGRQYVAILVGWGGALAGLGGPIGWSYGVHTRRLVAFALDGRATIPPQPPRTFATPVKADFVVDPTRAQAGAVVYGRCTTCHGPGAVAAGMAPDLRAAAVVALTDQFARIVRDGTRANRGMPRYAAMTDQELTQLQHFIRSRADAALAKR
jgi:quinohemoprotein ethanol dehydrogenase